MRDHFRRITYLREFGEHTMPTIEDAISLATALHKGQVDKAGTPYILHPLRVMFRLKTEEEQITGVLHDVVEDCEITLDRLAELGYSPEIIEALDYLTKRPQEEHDHDAFISRIRRGPALARNVKIADIEDNSDLTRIPIPTEKDYKRLEKYRLALQSLKST
jgi:(p)ppGpp synthase/HD superfamily hydrolase